MFLREQHPPQRIAFRVLKCHFVPVIRRAPAPIRSESARRVRLPHRSHPCPNLLPQPLQIGQRQHAFDLHVIHLWQVRPIFQHLRRQVPVVCQKHQARRRIIQPPHRINTLGQSTQTIPQRLAPLRIGHCRHHFRRLVQHDVDAPFLSFYDFPGRFNPVLPRIRLGAQFLHHAPVHAHLSAQDQVLRVPPRRNPRPRNYLLQSLLHFLDFVFLDGPFQSATHCPLSAQKIPSFRAQRSKILTLWEGICLFSVSSVLIPFLPLNLKLLTFNLSICASLFSVTSVLNSYSPAAAAFRDSSLSPSGIPSFDAAVSSNNSSRASISALAVFSVTSSAFAPGLLSLATRHSSLATSPAGANPSSLPSASRAKASNSFKLGSSSRSLNPNRIKNSFDVLYKIGRPITSLRPAVVIRCLSSSVLITPEVFTPRISEISGDVTGCLYAITASVSSAGMDSLSGGRKLLMNRRTTSWCCGLVYILYPPATARISIPRSSVA